jgi:hypothetical protein
MLSGYVARQHDGAGARRYGGCLQSSFKWVRLPPASLFPRKELFVSGLTSGFVRPRLALDVPNMESKQSETKELLAQR